MIRFFSPGSVTIHDDAGKAVKLLDPAGMSEWPSKGDERVAALVSRVRLTMSRGSTITSVVILVAALFVLFGWSMFNQYFRGAFPRIPGVLHLVILVVIIKLLILSTWRTGLYTRRNEVARLILAEGLCPSCGYNFAGLGDQGGADTLSCPECGASWKKHRILRLQAFDPAVPLAVPTKLVRKHTNVPRWSVLDDRGVPIKLVHPCLRLQRRMEANPDRLQRLEAARRQIAPSGRWLRAPLSAAVAIFAIACVVAAVRSSNDAGQIAVVIASAALLACSAAMFWGNFLYGRKATRRIMLEQGLCPGCASDIAGPVHADGCVECPGCQAAWRATPPTETP